MEPIPAAQQQLNPFSRNCCPRDSPGPPNHFFSKTTRRRPVQDAETKTVAALKHAVAEVPEGLRKLKVLGERPMVAVGGITYDGDAQDTLHGLFKLISNLGSSIRKENATTRIAYIVRGIELEVVAEESVDGDDDGGSKLVPLPQGTFMSRMVTPPTRYKELSSCIEQVENALEITAWDCLRIGRLNSSADALAKRLRKMEELVIGELDNMERLRVDA